MILAVASGKGGAGKTTVAVNLARTISSETLLLDCDVEEPNAHLFFRGERISSDVVSTPVPAVDESLCEACGICARFCRHNAIASFETFPLVFPELCHGCGGCVRVCPRRALREVPRRIGVIETSRSGAVTLIQGRLDIGVAMAPPLIRALKLRAAGATTVIIDSPPGASCSAVSSIQGVDLVVLVAEPTPFGLHDLKLAVEMTRAVGVPFGVVVNRAGCGDNRVKTFCEEEGVPVLLEIPEDRRIAQACSRGRLFVEALPEYSPLFVQLAEGVEALGGEHLSICNMRNIALNCFGNDVPGGREE